MRISFTGLSSGLDVNKIIDQLMQIERQPIRRSEARIALSEQRLGHWRDLNLALDALSTSLQPLLLRSTFDAVAASSSATEVAGVALTGQPAAGSYRLTVEQLAARHMVTSSPAPGSLIADADAPLSLHGSFYIGLATTALPTGSPAQEPESWITVQEGDSLNRIARLINDRFAATSVSASVIKAAEGDYRLILESRVEGAEARLVFTQFQPQMTEEEAAFGSDQILRALAVVDEAGNFTRELQPAQDARLRLNGLEIQRRTNTVGDLIPGLTLSLTRAGETTVEVAQNQEPALQAARSFVEAYNRVNSLLRSLQDRETGPLQGDPLIMRIERQLRQLVSAVADAPAGAEGTHFHRLAEIGLNTTDRQGNLLLDEARWQSALEEDAQSVFLLLGRLPAAQEGAGLARRMNELAGQMIGAGGIISGRESLLQRQIRHLEQDITRWEYRLELREQNLLRRFAAMERYFSIMQGQSGLLGNFAQHLPQE